MALALAILIPVGVFAVYLPLGSPGMPARPLASRDLERERGLPPPDVIQAVASLKKKLQSNPDDHDGWGLLARASARMGEWADAVTAFRNLMRLDGGDIDAKAGLAEAIVNAGDGQVSEEARKLLHEVLAVQPEDPRARYFVALGKRQSGDTKAALADWQALMAASPADAPWLELVRRRIAETAGTLGIDVAAATPQPLPALEPHPVAPGGAAPGGAAASGAAGPGAAASGGPGGMPGDAAGRDKMIRGMVKQLADRLATHPDDVEGWLRLARSYTVLGEFAKAEEAARAAITHAPKRADGYVALADALLAAGAKPDPKAPLPEAVADALRRALDVDPNNRDALWLLGGDAASRGRKGDAAALWGRLLASLEANDPDRAYVKQRIEALR